MINVTKKDKTLPPSQANPYPWIGQWHDLVILFIGPNTGVCLASGLGVAQVGKYETNWSENVYKPYAGDLVLSNK